MPTYEYECQKCGNAFERFQSIKDEPLKRCPKCRGKVRKIIGRGAGIIFKGTGFYQTDYRSDNYKKGQKADSSSGGSGGGGEKKDSSKSGGGESKTPAAASKN